MADGEVLRFRYGRMLFVFGLIGMGPTFTWMQVGEEEFRVRFSWAFSTRIPRSSIRHVDYDHDFIGSIGVHGRHGVWLVNATGTGMVGIDVDPPVRAFVMGVPVRVHRLRVSAGDPARLIALLAPR